VLTAAAFVGVTEAAIELSALFEGLRRHVEALMNVDRAVERRAVLRTTSPQRRPGGVGRRLRAARQERLARVRPSVRRSATRRTWWRSARSLRLTETMIDPRGGAPTTGLGYVEGLAITTNVGEEQLNRTRSLLGDDVRLAASVPRRRAL
jgi:hypothetical protein